MGAAALHNITTPEGGELVAERWPILDFPLPFIIPVLLGDLLLKVPLDLSVMSHVLLVGPSGPGLTPVLLLL